MREINCLFSITAIYITLFSCSRDKIAPIETENYYMNHDFDFIPDTSSISENSYELDEIVPINQDTSTLIYWTWLQSRIAPQSDDIDDSKQHLINTLFELRDTPVRILVKEGNDGRYFTAKRKKYKKGLKTHYASVQAVFDEKKDVSKVSSQLFYLSAVPLTGEYTIKTKFSGDKDDYYMVPAYNKSNPDDYFIFGSTSGAGTEGMYNFKPTSDEYFNIESILVGSDDPDNPSPDNVWNYSWENKGSKSSLGKFKNQSQQKFYIIPDDEYLVDSVTFHNDETASIAQIPDFVVVWEYENNTSVTQQMTTSFASSASRTSSFSNTMGISVNVSSSFSVKTPMAMNMSISLTSSYSHTWGATETSSDSRNYNFPIIVPPHKRVVAKAQVSRYKINIGYTTKLKCERTGHILHLDGRWEGIDCTDIKATCNEYDILSGKIVKSKTFNSIPNETVVL